MDAATWAPLRRISGEARAAAAAAVAAKAGEAEAPAAAAAREWAARWGRRFLFLGPPPEQQEGILQRDVKVSG